MNHASCHMVVGLLIERSAEDGEGLPEGGDEGVGLLEGVVDGV